MKRFLVSHPHAAAFANGAAAGFAQAGMLARYVTGVAAAPDDWRGALLTTAARWRPAAANRLLGTVTAEQVQSLGGLEMAARGLGALGPRLGMAGLPSAYDAMFTAHDAAVALLPWPDEVTAVYAYEDGAAFTFARARKNGVACVWDLPLPHWGTVERMWKQEAARWPDAVERVPVEPAWKKLRKDDELNRADVVSVASAFTKASLHAVGVKQRVVVTPYGFEPDAFAEKKAAPEGPFSVVAVGSHDLRKGTPYLLEAWKKAALKDATLTLVGPLRLRKAFVDGYAGLFAHVPHMAKARLPEVYQRADVLAFPTLGDGFGLVIQEAMCSGTPVITTRCGGGPECITPGENGWIIEERSVDALVEALRFAHGNRDHVYRMGKMARVRAEQWTWADAGNALARGVTAALEK